MKQPIRILFVCSANLCRSVTAAEYARRVAQRHRSCPDRLCPLEWRLESVGTAVSPGQALPPSVADEMIALGIPPRQRPTMISEEYVRSADVILTAERHHRATVVTRYPFAVRYAFTLLQFAYLLDNEPGASRISSTGNALLDLARIGQSTAPPVDDNSIDIADPVALRSAEAMHEASRAISTAVHTIIGKACRNAFELPVESTSS